MKKVIVIVLLFCSFSVIGQNDPQKIIDEFFKLYKEKSSDEALDYIFSTNKWWVNKSKDQVEGIKTKIKTTVVQAMGDYFGFDLITKKAISDKFILYTYLVKYDWQPIRFSFLLYNPNGQWRLQNFSYDVKLDEELEEASKAYRLKENSVDNH